MAARRGMTPWSWRFAGALLLACLVHATSPRAFGNVDESATRRVVLAKEKSFKVRLAAAIALGRELTDANVAALITALLVDVEPEVRRAAGVGVGNACQGDMPGAPSRLSAKTRDEACRALERVRTNDDPRLVTIARDALAAERLERSRQMSLVASAAPANGLYIYIPVSKQTAEHKHLIEAMGASLAESSSSFVVDWSSKSPQQADAQRRARRAFRVDVATARIDVKRGARGRISLQCSVSLAVAPWHGAGEQERWRAAETAHITGSARVESAMATGEAAVECVRALGRDVAAKRLAVFLRASAGDVPSGTQVAQTGRRR